MGDLKQQVQPKYERKIKCELNFETLKSETYTKNIKICKLKKRSMEYSQIILGISS